MKEMTISGSTYRKANWALGITALGLAAAYPFQGNFWGGLFTSGCSAGLIGGLADWFAVTALFRKPLGIRPGKIFRTEIIPRNRERIFTSLTHMVQDELLSKEALKQKISSFDFTAWVEKLLAAEGIVRLRPILHTTVTMTLKNIEVQDIDDLWGRRFIREKSGYHDSDDDNCDYKDKDTRAGAKRFLNLIQGILRDTIKEALANGSAEVLLRGLAHELSLCVQSREMHRFLAQWIEEALTDYVQENPSRKIVKMFLPDTTELTARVQMQIVNYLEQGEAVRAGLQWLGDFMQSERFLEWSQSVARRISREGKDTFLPQMLNSLQEPENAKKLVDFLSRQIENYRLGLQEQPEKRKALNQKAQALLTQFIVKQHDRIGKIVREGLEKYSDEMLVDLIEAKAGADLQMIRINGSVVGALVGMIFYLINFFL